MSEIELQAELDRVRGELSRVTGERDRFASDNGRLTEDNNKLRSEQRDRRHENKGLADQLAALMHERDDFKTRAEMTSSEWQAKLDGAQQTIRKLKHEQTFAKVAKALKVADPTKLADLVKIAGYEPETDDPDEAKIAATFQEALKSRPWLAEAEPKPGAGASSAVPGGTNGTGRPGPGSDRGESLSVASSSRPTNRIPGRL